MSTYPVSPNEMCGGLMYFPRMLDKIRMHGCGKLPADYHENFSRRRPLTGCCAASFALTTRSSASSNATGTDEKILEWCYANGRRLNEGDMMLWNAFIAKLGWNDFTTRFFEHSKEKEYLTYRTDIQTIVDFIDLDEGRLR